MCIIKLIGYALIVLLLLKNRIKVFRKRIIILISLDFLRLKRLILSQKLLLKSLWLLIITKIRILIRILNYFLILWLKILICVRLAFLFEILFH